MAANTDLTNVSVGTGFTQLLHIGDDDGIEATEHYVVDGNGTASALSLGTTAVGVGTDNPGEILDIYGTNPAVQIKSDSTTGTSTLFFSDAGGASGRIRYYHNDDALGLFTVGSERLRILSGGGLTFNGDTATANALDDYEEGTWTPLYAPATGSFATMTMDVQHATYTRIGRQVTLNASFRTDNVDVTGGGGDLQVRGLPYAPSSHFALNISYAVLFASGEYPIGGYSVGTSWIVLVERSAVDGTTTECVADTLATGANANYNRMMFTATYFV